MNSQTILAEKLLSEVPVPIDNPGSFGTFSVYASHVSHDTSPIATNLQHHAAVTMRDMLQKDFGGTYDIIEDKSWGRNGLPLFAGNDARFFHTPNHITNDVPLYDVQIDGQIIARNLTIEAAQEFVRGSVDILDIFSAIADFIVSPEFSFEDAMNVIRTMTPATYYGATIVQYNPAENDAPTPAPSSSDNWKRKKTVGKSKVHKVRELSYLGCPEELKEYSVLDVSNLHVLYSGTKKSCLLYMNARMESGVKLYSMRIVKYENLLPYTADTLGFGWKLKFHGETICIGTKKEVLAYIVNAVSRTDESYCKVERIVS